VSFVRPEVAAAIARWREAGLWGAALLAGLILIWRGYARVEPLVFVLGLVLATTGFALARGALARMQFGGAPAAAGVVAIDEGRIGLMGPEGGGYVDLSDLVSVEVRGRGAHRVWVLVAEDGARLVVPFGAVGAEALPDTLAALPGIDFEAAAPGDGRLWTRDARRVRSH
jgi:hypothetical protein